MSFRRVQRAARRSVAYLLVAIVCAATTGLLPTSGLVQSLRTLASGDRFACEGGHCGCSTALHCWTECCCMTMPQRLAWAITHGVSPPSYARFSADEARAARSIATQKMLLQARAARQGPASCCSKERQPVSCCDSTASEPSERYSPPTLTPLKCRGVDLLVLVSLAPAPTGSGRPWLEPLARAALEAAPVGALPTRGLDVPVPPPRATA